MSNYKLAFEAFKRESRLNLGLSPEQAEALVQQVQPIGEVLAAYQSTVQAIRKNSMLSDAGKNAEAEKARFAAMESIVNHAAKVDRTEVITGLAQQVNTRVTGARTRAAGQQQDAVSLAQELRQSVLPAMIREAKAMQIPAGQTVAKLALKAAESYAANPAKAETVIGALSVGWPWCPDLPEGTIAQVEATIAGQVAADEQAALLQAQGVQRLIDKVVAAAGQELRELG